MALTIDNKDQSGSISRFSYVAFTAFPDPHPKDLLQHIIATLLEISPERTNGIAMASTETTLHCEVEATKGRETTVGHVRKILMRAFPPGCGLVWEAYQIKATKHKQILSLLKTFKGFSWVAINAPAPTSPPKEEKVAAEEPPSVDQEMLLQMAKVKSHIAGSSRMETNYVLSLISTVERFLRGQPVYNPDMKRDIPASNKARWNKNQEKKVERSNIVVQPAQPQPLPGNNGLPILAPAKDLMAKYADPEIAALLAKRG
jgi:hypothetical protein